MKLTKQELYDLQVLGVLTHAFPSIKKTGGCCYRGDNDPKSEIRCSIGIAMSDDEYKPEMDGCDDTDYVSLSLEEVVPPPIGMDIKDMQELQGCHDRQVSMVGFKQTSSFEFIRNKWNGEEFLQAINKLYFFSDVIQVVGLKQPRLINKLNET